jgi:hypothetical protein
MRNGDKPSTTKKERDSAPASRSQGASEQNAGETAGQDKPLHIKVMILIGRRSTTSVLHVLVKPPIAIFTTSQPNKMVS